MLANKNLCRNCVVKIKYQNHRSHVFEQYLNFYVFLLLQVLDDKIGVICKNFCSEMGKILTRFWDIK